MYFATVDRSRDREKLAARGWNGISDGGSEGLEGYSASGHFKVQDIQTGEVLRWISSGVQDRFGTLVQAQCQYCDRHQCRNNDFRALRPNAAAR